MVSTPQDDIRFHSNVLVFRISRKLYGKQMLCNKELRIDTYFSTMLRILRVVWGLCLRSTRREPCWSCAATDSCHKKVLNQIDLKEQSLQRGRLGHPSYQSLTYESKWFVRLKICAIDGKLVGGVLTTYLCPFWQFCTRYVAKNVLSEVRKHGTTLLVASIEKFWSVMVNVHAIFNDHRQPVIVKIG